MSGFTTTPKVERITVYDKQTPNVGKRWKVEEEKVTKLKNEGNELFKQGKLLESLIIYDKGLKKWATFLEKNEHNFKKNENHLLSIFHSNIGLCHKKLYDSGDTTHYYDDGSGIARMSRLEAALCTYSQAIDADPLWEKPHLKKSVIFQILKDVYTSDEGVLDSIDVINDRKAANIIVDLSQACPRRKVNNQLIFNQFQKGLDACKEGDTIFLENGVYKFERSFRIDKKITLVGASTAAVLRCDNVGDASAPLATCTVYSSTYPVIIKRLRFQMLLYVKSCFTVGVEQCLFDGQNHLVLIQVDPVAQQNVKIPKEWRKMVNWNGSEKKKTVDTCPIIINIKMCLFLKCWRKNPLMVKGEAVNVSLINCLFEQSRGIIVRHGAVMAFQNCELNEKDRDDDDCDLIVMCSNKARLHLLNTNVMAGRNVSGVMFAYKTIGDIHKSFFQYIAAIPAKIGTSLLLIEEANVTVERTTFHNESSAGLKDDQIGIMLNRQYSSSSKIVNNKFLDCCNAINLNNGASPVVHGNEFNGNTKKHIYLAGGANPKIVENVFDLSGKANPKITIGVCYVGGSGGMLAKNRFVNGSTSVCVDESSMPILLDNVYEKPVLNVAQVGPDTFITFRKHEGNTFINSVEQEKEMTENSRIAIENAKENLRLCAKCKEYKACDVCGKCKSTYYCSPECQRTHWPKHEPSCLSIEKLKFKAGRDVFLSGKLREPCREGCPYWTKNFCQSCKL